MPGPGYGSQVNVPRPSGSSRYQAPQSRMGRSQFDLTHSHKTTFDAGDLVPYFCRFVWPGDTMTCRLNSFVRIFSPLDAPIMDDIALDIDFFYVPCRLVWEHWDEFLGASATAGVQPTDYTIPILADGNTVALGDLHQYMGLPIGMQTTATEVSSLPMRSYYLIYNEWYRDQNLINAVVFSTGDGPDTVGTALRKSAKKHDYFTSALPYLQKGDPVTVALGTTAAVIGELAGSPTRPSFRNLGGTVLGGQTQANATANVSAINVNSPVGDWTAGEGMYWDDPALFADLTTATGVSINALREAEAVQRFLERDARGGTRLPEKIRAHFGVDVPDFRVQRPEYLGGGRGNVLVSPVANTSDTANRDQGELTGVGAGQLRASWAKSFVEHGYVIGLLRARAQLTYQQGVDRHWTRSTVLDLMWPDLVNLGEQPIYKRELFIENDATDDEVFGYQERYAECRWERSLVTGKFASDAAGSLDFWHLAEDFASAPALNQTFVEDASPMSRVTTVDTEPDFIIDGRFDLRVARVLPVRPVPSLAPARF